MAVLLFCMFVVICCFVLIERTNSTTSCPTLTRMQPKVVCPCSCPRVATTPPITTPLLLVTWPSLPPEWTTHKCRLCPGDPSRALRIVPLRPFSISPKSAMDPWVQTLSLNQMVITHKLFSIWYFYWNNFSDLFWRLPNQLGVYIHLGPSQILTIQKFPLLIYGCYFNSQTNMRKNLIG